MRLVTRTGRIGLLGGTLDPIHLGHVEAATAAQQALALDPVIVMPSRVPPHRHEPSASMFHRFAMTALAINDFENIMVSDEELASEGPSYTAMTLERFLARGLEPTRLFFITGADAFAEIETWYRYPGVLDLAHFVVISRPGASLDALTQRLPALRERFAVPSRTAPMPPRPSVFLVDARTSDVSSTDIRRRLREGMPIAGLVPSQVERYIVRQRLYLEQRDRDPNRAMANHAQ
jgi:nicotinate-nucleotide adenylyltransferase